MLAHAQTWRDVIDRHDELVQRAGNGDKVARRRLTALYKLFAGTSAPSLKKLNDWLKPPMDRPLSDFMLFLVHRALAAQIEDRVRPDWEPVELPTWVPAALRMDLHAVNRLIDDAGKGDAMQDGRGPSTAAVEALAKLGRFGASRSIWRSIERYRKAKSLPVRRPHRPARSRAPVPSH